MLRRVENGILDLFEYRSDVVTGPLPLSFDRVNGGQPPSSTAPLWNFPVEILGQIFQYVPHTSLAQVALVNSDFRQLARSRQFASVRLDSSEHCLDLVEKLVAEEQERAARKGTLQPCSIGACIRHITVDTKVERYPECFDDYVLRLQALLPTLPHLELLDWEDMLDLPRSFFNNIACSHIQHLKLHRVYVEDEFKLSVPNARGSGAWPLRTLHLELQPIPQRLNEFSTLPLCSSILGSCAPTLETLTWTALPHMSEESRIAAIEPMDTLPPFKALRRLSLGDVGLTNSCLLSALVQDGLRVLYVDTEASPVYAAFFRQRGSIRSLKTFVWDAYIWSTHPQLDFLRANPQLSKLAMPNPAPKELLDQNLLPLLVSSFTALTSLSLVWAGVSISESALDTISSLTSLEQIHLSAGFQAGWRHDWLADHDIMRKYLGRLPSLKRIAFSRDSYNFHNIHPSHVESYYSAKMVFSDDLITLDQYLVATGQPTTTIFDLEMGRVKLWEQTHREKMTSETLLYMETVKELEWIYVGQLPYHCFGSPKDSICVGEERKSGETFLRKMFG